MKDKIEARIAGYTYAVRNPYPRMDYDLDHECAMWYGESPVPSDIEGAWYQGVRDAKLPDELLYCSIAIAAHQKDVDANTIRRILWDDERRAKIFPQAIREGEGARAIWHIHFEDLANWTPDKRGRKKLER